MKLSLKLFTPHNLAFKTHDIPCPKGRRDEDQLGKAVEEFCAAYEKGYPGHEFAARYVGRGRYNIVWIAERA